MVPWNRCTMRWLLVTGCDVLAFRSSKLPPYQLSFARGRAVNSFITPKSSSLWCSRKFDHPPGSSRPLTRHQGQTYLCNSCLGYLCWFLARILFFLWAFIHEAGFSSLSFIFCVGSRILDLYQFCCSNLVSRDNRRSSENFLIHCCWSYNYWKFLSTRFASGYFWGLCTMSRKKEGIFYCVE